MQDRVPKAGGGAVDRPVMTPMSPDSSAREDGGSWDASMQSSNEYFNPKTGKGVDMDGWVKLRPEPDYPGASGGEMVEYPVGDGPQRWGGPRTGEQGWDTPAGGIPAGWAKRGPTVDLGPPGGGER